MAWGRNRTPLRSCLAGRCRASKRRPVPRVLPRILRATRLVPVGRAGRLQPLRIRGSERIDPGRDDLFRRFVEDRRRLERRGDPESLRSAATLKVAANAGSYGIAAELNRQQPGEVLTNVDV